MDQARLVGQAHQAEPQGHDGDQSQRQRDGGILRWVMAPSPTSRIFPAEPSDQHGESDQRQPEMKFSIDRGKI